MHILLTNDDGPPNPHTSPYLSTFVRILTSPPFNHKLSVIVPSTQRSWIGKAHLIPPSTYALAGQSTSNARDGLGSSNEILDDTVTVQFYDPATDKVHEAPATKEEESRWALVPGTPATCVQLGLFQRETLFPSHEAPLPPFDLVLSGPNYGRNTTAAFALSSGTLGGGLEGAICGVKSIAISYAFFTRQEPESLVEEATIHAARIVEKLMNDWAAIGDATGDAKHASRDISSKMVPDIFTINVPLVEGMSKNPIKWTWMLDNKWQAGSLYKPVDSNGAQYSFRWSPNFSDVWKTVEESEPGNDGQVIRQGCTSVTALKANFQGLYNHGYRGVIKL
ncbi:MAG: hypothetical protein M1828_005818 [Chrysothrix sp. TS-e1954]|nr:MAG: hypothetical protein M1828_005818 [Chrysothrix sp. TS-e1954]